MNEPLPGGPQAWYQVTVVIGFGQMWGRDDEPRTSAERIFDALNGDAEVPGESHVSVRTVTRHLSSTKEAFGDLRRTDLYLGAEKNAKVKCYETWFRMIHEENKGREEPTFLVVVQVLPCMASARRAVLAGGAMRKGTISVDGNVLKSVHWVPRDVVRGLAVEHSVGGGDASKRRSRAPQNPPQPLDAGFQVIQDSLFPTVSISANVRRRIGEEGKSKAHVSPLVVAHLFRPSSCPPSFICILGLISVHPLVNSTCHVQRVFRRLPSLSLSRAVSTPSNPKFASSHTELTKVVTADRIPRPRSSHGGFAIRENQILTRESRAYTTFCGFMDTTKGVEVAYSGRSGINSTSELGRGCGRERV
ncbi:hypothetical protein BDM02DRAFT_3131568 [Thelephora ganbajun]|uniref:Uncharacterized protein n=1 Tax=Thelephora ganbajun TaxID=370292 RepID=A0ACB6Z611_THEGA|nr:hypothetical protein BDM02DRAFT_3131568 [Thelephora ganbajun]